MNKNAERIFCATRQFSLGLALVLCFIPSLNFAAESGAKVDHLRTGFPLTGAHAKPSANPAM